MENSKRTLPTEAEQHLQELLTKTFQTGYGITPDTQHDAAALRYEFLEDEVKMLAYDTEDFTIYPMIHKSPVKSTVTKYPVFLQHGRAGHSRFVSETGVSTINDPKLRQRTVYMKFISDVKQQSIASGLVNNVADPMSILMNDAITVIAKTIEWGIFYGDASLSAEPEEQGGLEFDGLHKLIDQSTNVMDLRGESLTEKALNTAVVIVGKGYGKATDAFMPIGVQADFTNSLLHRQYAIMPTNGGGMSTGFSVTDFNSARGLIKLHGSTIMENDLILDETLPPQQNAPLPPTGIDVQVLEGAGGRFRAEDLGTQTYKVVVHSDEAESIPSEEVTAVVESETDAVELTVKLQPLYQAKPQYISVYRQGKETGYYYLISRIPLSKINENNEIVFKDVNDRIPETTDVFVGEMSPQVIRLLELLPMLRLPLAQMNAATTFALLWYGALALYKPKAWVHIKNVKYIPALAADINVKY